MQRQQQCRNTIRVMSSAAAAILVAVAAAAQVAEDDGESKTKAPAAVTVEAAINAAAVRILEMQEGEDDAEWPYEGVYRVREEQGGSAVIPIGYRVGGTSIAALALLTAPGFDDDEPMRAAVERAARFVIESIEHPLMQFDRIPGTYDVRGWGYAYGALFLLAYRDRAADDLAADADDAIRFFLEGIEATEIPQSGGWNYARRGGFDRPGSMSPFMTAPTLQALFTAREAGYAVDAAVVSRGLDALEKARTDAGAFVYSGAADDGGAVRSAVPGAAARMAAAEATLHLAGRSSVAAVRSAIDAFIVHWEWLDQRRAKDGTHVGPYGIAPYYFYYGHYYAAQAVELLPEHDREEYRRRIRDLLWRTRLEDGSWNDRVFPRSANYGTAMSLMVLAMPESDLPPRWEE